MMRSMMDLDVIVDDIRRENAATDRTSWWTMFDFGSVGSAPQGAAVTELHAIQAQAREDGGNAIIHVTFAAGLERSVAATCLRHGAAYIGRRSRFG